MFDAKINAPTKNKATLYRSYETTTSATHDR